jgi:signal transduction histidine kinase
VRRWGIRARVLFLALTPSVLILLSLVTYFTYTRIAEVDVSLAQHGRSIARHLAPGAEFALFAGDRAALQRLTDAAAREADVESVTITDAQGQTLARSGPRALPAAESVRFTQPVMETRLATVDLPEQMHAANAPAKIGEVTVEMSRSATQAQQRRLLLNGLALGCAGVLLAVALAIAIGNSVIRPIRGLAGAMAKLGRGSRVAPLPTAGGGEFRTLSDGFNQMAARLQADARELEGRIEDATRALIEQKDTAEQATSAKSRFIAAASHDLRQPLHAIGLFTATLQRRTEGSELEAIVDDLAQAVAVMARLFDSLLDISRLDSGTLHAESRPFQLDRLFAQVAAEYFDAADKKGLRLHVRPTHAVVVSDELLLHRLLANLVANAIRYTNEGTVMICGRRRDPDILIEVRDSGIGIPPDRQKEIFEEFYQVGNVARDRSLGLGLGLAIVSRLARLVNTQVAVRSAPGRGSVFSLRVPRGEEADVVAPAEQPEVIEEPQASSLAVLVVDDDPLVLSGHRALLEELGCIVKTAEDGRSAQAALATFVDKPVLIFCDLWLPGGRNGIEVLRALAALTNAPISGILISGDTRPETIQTAKAAGYPLLHKPVSPAKLRAVVTHFAWTTRKETDPGFRDEDIAR